MIKVEKYKDEYYQFWQIKYNDLELLRFLKSNEDDHKWVWVSKEMNVEDDYMLAETFDEAVCLLKEKIMDFYYEKMGKYESIAQEAELSMSR